VIQILIVDDHRMFRQGLKRLIEEHDDVRVVAEAANAAEAVDALRANPVDLGIFDLSMPGRGGVELIAHAKELLPAIRVLVISMHGDDPYVTQALRAGADGYMTKEYAADDLLQAVRRVASGGRYICSSVAEGLARGIVEREGGGQLHTRLTEREYRVFQMLGAGKKGSDIAKELSLSEKTVSTHKANVLQKMDMSNRTELVKYAMRNQLVAP
jgi:DNA-binding NarL/FixJ family response regulator